MENRLTLIAVFLLGFFPVTLFAYEPHSTHDALTHDAVLFYNHFAPSQGLPVLSLSDSDLLRKGAMDEDNDFRMAHHFYDPVHETGLKGHVSSKEWAQMPAYQGAWLRGDKKCLPRPKALYALYESPCDHSWQRAIYEYVHGDRSRALESLGHTLHLIEDASVPDHTRDDAHIPIFDETITEYDESFTQKSPFESYTNQFSISAGNVHVASSLLSEGALPAQASSLDAFFLNAARYSNSNFFSKSTIFDTRYVLPIEEYTKEHVLSNSKSITVSYFNHHPIARRTNFIDETRAVSTFAYNLEDSDNFLLESYWNLTSRSAVTHASGVIALFFQEVKKEEQTHQLKKEKEADVKEFAVNTIITIGKVGYSGARLTMAFIGGVERTAYPIARLITGGVTHIATLLRTPTQHPLEEETPVLALLPPQAPLFVVSSSTPVLSHTPVTLVSPSPLSLADLMRRLSDAKRILDALPRTSTPVTSGLALTFPISPNTSPHVTSPKEEGVVLGTSTALALLAPSTPEPRIDLGVPQGSVPLPLPPSAPRFLSPFQHDIFTTPHISVSGEGSATATITLMTEDALGTTISLATTDGTGAFTFPVTLHPGTTTLSLIETDIHHQLSPPAVLQVVFSPPLPSAPTILTPTTSPVYLSTTTLTLSGSADPDTEILLSYDTITQSTTTDSDGRFALTALLPEGTTTLSLIARSSYDMTSTTTLEVGVVVPPLAPASPVWPFGAPSIVFSEVAWSGTRADPTHEWLELYNLTYSNRPLANLFVVSEDRSFVIPLSGTIPAQGYVVIASNPGIFQNNTPFLTHPFAHELPDSGMHLLLVYGSPESTTVVSEIPYCTDWCGLGDGGKTVMFPWYSDGGTVWDYTKVETYSPRWWLPDEESWSGVLDSSGLPILGTPGDSEPLAPFL